VLGVLIWAGFSLALAAAIVFVLVTVYRATWADLGLPNTRQEAAAEATLGVVAALAALAPVYIVLMALVWHFGERSQNPLLEKLDEHPSGVVFAAAAIAAVFAAPVFEEIVYRLAIQGWLEKLPMRSEAAAELAELDVATTQWTPILISSALFAAAHFGFAYGYSPVPLFLLAIILGYIYQRTHRILPCIIAHMTFNSITILLMWLEA
jgi:membrane protease YdiL (CAAX protease family)